MLWLIRNDVVESMIIYTEQFLNSFTINIGQEAKSTQFLNCENAIAIDKTLTSG